MSEKRVSLQQILESRDARRDRQLDYLEKFENSILVLLTVVMPGAVKRNHLSLTTAEAAIKALKAEFSNHIIQFDCFDLETGYEAFMVTDLDSEEAKRRACNIEDTHRLGRLFDIDVFGTDKKPMSRSALGFQPRKCLICGEDARVCMRSGKHDYAELLNHISEMVESYDD